MSGQITTAYDEFIQCANDRVRIKQWLYMWISNYIKNITCHPKQPERAPRNPVIPPLELDRDYYYAYRIKIKQEEKTYQHE